MSMTNSQVAPEGAAQVAKFPPLKKQVHPECELNLQGRAPCPTPQPKKIILVRCKMELRNTASNDQCNKLPFFFFFNKVYEAIININEGRLYEMRNDIWTFIKRCIP